MTTETKDEMCRIIAKALADCLELMESPRVDNAGKILYSVDDLAGYFGKSRETISRWIREGEFGTAVQTGNSVMVTAEGFEHYIQTHSGITKKTTPPRRRNTAATKLLERI